ncbi:MAG TPA: phage tail tube protein, partial [Symbiobacteriaceae bacterium]|nr:phage tail tube protein [Symbiobacteriaceae bacterium]
MAPAMVSSQTINGSYGELYLDGKFVAACKGVKAKVTIDKEEIKLSSTRRVGYKAKGVKGEGTLTLYKVDSAMLERVASYMYNDRSA